MKYVEFTENSIYRNLKRTSNLGLISILDRKEFKNLINKYYRDSEGVLHCAYTWKPISQDELELEHIIPVSLGGGTVSFNCVPCTSKINGKAQKSNNYLFDWWTQSGYYSKELLEKLVNFMFEAYVLFIKKGLSFDKVKLEESYIENLELQSELFEENLASSDDTLVIYKKSYIYYNFFKDCIDRLNKDKYKAMFEKLKETNIFKLINDYDEYLYMFKEYLNQKSMLDLSSIAINCNIPKIISVLALTKENFISTIDSKINQLYKQILKKTNYNISIDTILANILNYPEIIIYEELSDNFVIDLINKIYISKNDKFKLMIDYYKKNKKWPKESDDKYYTFSLSSFTHTVRAGEVKITEEQCKEILNLDSKFFMNQNDRATEETVNEIINFYKKTGRKPIQNHKPKTDEERYESSLGRQISRIKSKQAKIPETLKADLLDLDYNFFENTIEQTRRNTINEAINYYLNNGSWPKQTDSNEIISKLACKITALRIMEEKLSKEEVELIKSYDSKFFMNQFERKTEETVYALIDFYEVYSRWPIGITNPKTESEIYEKILAGRLRNIRNGGINISVEQKAQLEAIDETIFYNRQELNMIQNAKLVLQYFDSHNNNWPRIIYDFKS